MTPPWETGNDTLLLSTLAGSAGKVLAFDIQESALRRTEERLRKDGAPENWSLFLESHAHMSRYAGPCSVSCIVFNLGYLPGGGSLYGNPERFHVFRRLNRALYF